MPDLTKSDFITVVLGTAIGLPLILSLVTWLVFG